MSNGTPTNQPYVNNHPTPGLIVEGLNIKFAPGSGDYGIYVNGGTNVTFRNCRVEGFKFNMAMTGGNRGAQIYNNVLLNSTCGTANDSSGLYTEGLDGYSIHDNVILNSGWWPNYNPADPIQTAAAGRCHGWYNNESYGTSDNGEIYNNIVLDSIGSNIGSRKGGYFHDNVFRPGLDWDLIAASLGGYCTVLNNGFFGPRIDGPGYWGGGIHAIGTGWFQNNYFAGSAGSTLNAACQNNTGIVLPQVGYWPKAGASKIVPVWTPVPTLEAYYGVTADKLYAAIQQGDAKKIVKWLASQNNR